MDLIIGAFLARAVMSCLTVKPPRGASPRTDTMPDLRPICLPRR
ncbi:MULTISPECIES: hypothetical protein [Sulfitobacter]|nr:hypothetical protein [Sulfitobacter dubius]WOI29713.1 hypothetical protein R1T39_03120 [Sulfitobacter dubius]